MVCADIHRFIFIGTCTAYQVYITHKIAAPSTELYSSTALYTTAVSTVHTYTVLLFLVVLYIA